MPETVFERVFEFVLRLLDEAGLVKGKTLGIDATTLEANAAMKSIVRKVTGQDWRESLRELARAECIENPTEEDLLKMEKGRKDKKVSNRQWESWTDKAPAYEEAFRANRRRVRAGSVREVEAPGAPFPSEQPVPQSAAVPGL